MEERDCSMVDAIKNPINLDFMEKYKFLPFKNSEDALLSEGKCMSCDHMADRQFQWAPGHIGGLVCDCCVKKIWEETLDNVTRSLAELKVRCNNERS